MRDWSSDVCSSDLWPICLRWCLRRRNLTMRTLSARPWPTTFAVTLAPLSASPTLMPSPSPSMSTLSNVISLPASCSPSSSTRSVSPFITRYCLPPVTRTAYMIAFPDFVDLLVVLLWLPAIEGGQKRNCRGFRGLGSTSPAADHPCGSGFSRELWLQPLPCDSRGRLRAGPDGSWRCQRHSSPTVPESYSVRPGQRRPAVGRGGPRSSLSRASCPDSRAGHPWPA